MADLSIVKCSSDHPEDLTGGRMLAPGEYAEVDLSDEHNKNLVDEGHLLIVPPEVKVDVTIPEPKPPAEATTTPDATDDTEQPAPVEPVADPSGVGVQTGGDSGDGSGDKGKDKGAE
jgi:hypothetical protein